MPFFWILSALKKPAHIHLPESKFQIFSKTFSCLTPHQSLTRKFNDPRNTWVMSRKVLHARRSPASLTSHPATSLICTRGDDARDEKIMRRGRKVLQSSSTASYEQMSDRKVLVLSYVFLFYLSYGNVCNILQNNSFRL